MRSGGHMIGATKSVIGIAFGAVLVSVIGASAAPAATKVNPIRLLNSLPVSSEVTSGYSRDLFRHWSDLDGNGCDTREEVLIDERVQGSVQGCKVVDGVWYSKYDGVSTNNSSSFDIDHFIPLKEAWDSGAWRWDANTRQRFANDLGYAAALIAVTASSNRTKSDQDPSDWLPQKERCLYAKSWVAVKFRWRLSVDSDEKRSLAQILSRCSGKITVPSRAAITVGTTTKPSNSGGSSGSSGGTDPRFATCGEAMAAGYGPYRRGQDVEYDWYIDRDSDGSVCE